MPARSSILSPEAIRQRRCRRRQREELSFAYSEVPWRVIELLINHGRITENEAANANRRGEAILKAAEEFLDGVSRRDTGNAGSYRRLRAAAIERQTDHGELDPTRLN